LLSNLSVPDSISIDSHDDDDLIQSSYIIIEWYLNKAIKQFGMTNTVVIMVENENQWNYSSKASRVQKEIKTWQQFLIFKFLETT
jgi:hypothetical protein